jgi:hypothetical protein
LFTPISEAVMLLAFFCLGCNLWYIFYLVCYDWLTLM